MSKYHVLNIRQDMWDEIVTKSSTLVGISPSNLAKQYLLEGLHPKMAYNPPKTGVAPAKEIKKTYSKEPRMLLYDLKSETCNWIKKTDDNNDLYMWFFYFCKNRDWMGENMYGPLFRKNGDREITEDMRSRAKLLAQERASHMATVNAPRPDLSQMEDNSAEIDAYNKEGRDFLERGGMKDEREEGKEPT